MKTVLSPERALTKWKLFLLTKTNDFQPGDWHLTSTDNSASRLLTWSKLLFFFSFLWHLLLLKPAAWLSASYTVLTSGALWRAGDIPDRLQFHRLRSVKEMGPSGSWTKQRSMKQNRAGAFRGVTLTWPRAGAVGCGIESLAPGSREENLQTHCGLLKHWALQVLQGLAIPAGQTEVSSAAEEGKYGLVIARGDRESAVLVYQRGSLGDLEWLHPRHILDNFSKVHTVPN